jgi:hypothetical protein
MILAKELDEFREDGGGQVIPSFLSRESEIVADAFHDQQICTCRDELTRRVDLLDRSKRVFRPLHKKGENVKIREVLGSLLIRSRRWVQRIRQQEQAISETSCFLRIVIPSDRSGFARESVSESRNLLFSAFSQQHARLPSTITLATEKKAARRNLPHRGKSIRQPSTISECFAGPRRPKRTHLPERQIAPQHRETRASKGFREGHEHCHFHVAAGAMS